MTELLVPKYAERPTHIACQLFSAVDECENQLPEGGGGPTPMCPLRVSTRASTISW
jgi:hypothetical protein